MKNVQRFFKSLDLSLKQQADIAQAGRPTPLPY